MKTHPSRAVRLRKEFRQIAGPYFILAAILMASAWIPALRSLQLPLMIFAVLFPAAYSLGSEYRGRTFSLLQFQPISRSSLLIDKLIVIVPLTLMALAAFAANDLLRQFPSYLRGSPLRIRGIWHLNFAEGVYFYLLIGSALAGTLFWSTVSKSITGTLVFALVAPAFLAGTLSAAGDHWSHLFDRPMASILIGAAAVYVLLIVLLGWLRFCSMEALDRSQRQGAAPEARDSGPGALRNPTRREFFLSNFIRPRMQHRFLNLVGKELHLQMTNLLFAMVFALCVAAATFAAQSNPGESAYRGLVVISFFLYMPMSAALIGCASQVEERNLGMIASHLVQPVSTRTQYLLKFLASASVYATLGVAVPFALLYYSGQYRWMVDMALNGLVLRGHIPYFLASVFIGSFWMSTVTSNILGAVLTPIVIAFLCWNLPVWISPLIAVAMLFDGYLNFCRPARRPFSYFRRAAG